MKKRILHAIRKIALRQIGFLARAVNVNNRADQYCRGEGIEIGALSVPYPFTGATVRYADVSDSGSMRRTLDAIPIPGLYSGPLVDPAILLEPPRFGLDSVPDRSVDFVYSSHSLEHTPNPVFALSEQLRVVRPGGHVYAIIPNKEGTYDRLRPTTPTEVLVRKFREGVFEHTLEEAIELVEGTSDHPLYVEKTIAFAERVLADGSGVHHFHTFDPASTLEMLAFCASSFGCERVYFCVEDINIHFCLRRNAA